METEAQGMGEDDENEAENLNSDTSIFAPKKHSSSCSLVKIKWHDWGRLIWWLQKYSYYVILFFYINIYTLNKKIYNHQVYIYMSWYTWGQKNIHMKYKKKYNLKTIER